MRHLFVDTHVHLHPEFSRSSFFDAALENFEAHSEEVTGASDYILCMTDVEGVHTCRELLRDVSDGDWEFRETDAGSVFCEHPRKGKGLTIVPGRQIVSTERLELLALDSHLDLEDRRYSLMDLLERAVAEGALPVLPWGFGKWTGERENVVKTVLASGLNSWVADNGNRMSGTSEPALLRSCREKGRNPLAGSDPLPFRRQQNKAGSYVIHFETMHQDTPRQSLRKCLTEGLPFRIEGSLATPFDFFRDQVAMQIRKRLPGTS